MDRVDLGELTDRIAAVLEQEAPDVVATFGPDGITGHPDHIAVGAATGAALARLAGSGRPGFKRLLHRVLPQSVFDRWQRQRVALGLPVFDPSKTYHGRGVPDEEIGVEVDCRSVSERVVAGILEHRSQLHVMTDQPINLERLQRIVSREWSAVTWPPRGELSPRLTDVFDGL